MQDMVVLGTADVVNDLNCGKRNEVSRDLSPKLKSRTTAVRPTDSSHEEGDKVSTSRLD